MSSNSKHASSAPLCLNLKTGAIGPQYHVVFDDDFATVSSDPANLPHINFALYGILTPNTEPVPEFNQELDQLDALDVTDEEIRELEAIPLIQGED